MLPRSLLSARARIAARFLHTSGVKRTAAAESVCEQISGELRAIESAGTYKRERVICGRQGVLIKVANSDEPLLNFCANNYLGLSSDPSVIEAGKRALQTHGAGLSSVRFICGTQDIHRELEAKLAAFHQRDDAILYAACFDANAGIFEVLLGADDAVISDKLNHASIIDGIRLCKAKRFRYKHLDMDDLRRCLEQAQSCRRRLVVTDGAFSMDGDVAPLADICRLADRHGAMVMVDECHATGFVGDTGRGSEEHARLPPGTVDIINSTLGKALGGAMGGYTVARQPIVDVLRQRSRPYLFSNSLAPSVVGSSIRVLDMLTGDASHARSLAAKTAHFRHRMRSVGFSVAGDPAHPICPVMLGDAKLAGQFAEAMLRRGIYVIGFSFPVVPEGTARIRVQISAAHQMEHIDRCVDAFIDVGKQLGLV